MQYNHHSVNSLVSPLKKKFVKTSGGGNFSLAGFAIISVTSVLLLYLPNSVAHLDWTRIKNRTIWRRFDSRFLSFKQFSKSYWVFWTFQSWILHPDLKLARSRRSMLQKVVVFQGHEPSSLLIMEINGGYYCVEISAGSTDQQWVLQRTWQYQSLLMPQLCKRHHVMYFWPPA